MGTAKREIDKAGGLDDSESQITPARTELERAELAARERMELPVPPGVYRREMA